MSVLQVDGRLRGRWLAYAIAIWLGGSAFLFATARPQDIAWSIGPDSRLPTLSGMLTTNAVHTWVVGIMTSDKKFFDFDCEPEGKNRVCDIPRLIDNASAKQTATIWYVRRQPGFLDGHSRQLLARLRAADGTIDYDRRAWLKRYRATAKTEPDYEHLYKWVFVGALMIAIGATKGFGGASASAH